MSEGINIVTLCGNLGADPELKLGDGGPILKMRIATNRTWIDKEQKKQERTDWHNITVFGRRAEALSKILAKGMTLVVQGRLSTSSYDKNGEKRYWTEVIAEDLRFFGGPRSASNGGYTRPPLDPSLDATDLPF
jgi:single-strand DNA-binding protein